MNLGLAAAASRLVVTSAISCIRAPARPAGLWFSAFRVQLESVRPGPSTVIPVRRKSALEISVPSKGEPGSAGW
jgi:hypothetical protein